MSADPKPFFVVIDTKRYYVKKMIFLLTYLLSFLKKGKM